GGGGGGAAVVGDQVRADEYHRRGAKTDEIRHAQRLSAQRRARVTKAAGGVASGVTSISPSGMRNRVTVAMR
ncbi:MAG TPA: hypothetical protein VHV31_13335, partial [Nitrolancea sp.]|nr:hypothetical protein [Nitrolancea sp.]